MDKPSESELNGRFSVEIRIDMARAEADAICTSQDLDKCQPITAANRLPSFRA